MSCKAIEPVPQFTASSGVRLRTKWSARDRAQLGLNLFIFNWRQTLDAPVVELRAHVALPCAVSVDSGVTRDGELRHARVLLDGGEFDDKAVIGDDGRGRPSMASCAASRARASYLRVAAGVYAKPLRVMRGRPFAVGGPAMVMVDVALGEVLPESPLWSLRTSEPVSQAPALSFSVMTTSSRRALADCSATLLHRR
jgi:hypothetical protein